MTPEQRKVKLAQLRKLKKQHENLLREQKRLQAAEAKFEKENKLLFFGHPGKGYLGPHGSWNPTRPQNQAFTNFVNPNIFTLIYEGGNRGGKTFTLVCLALACMRGKFPWEPEENTGWIWKLFGWKGPIKIRIVGQDWKKHILEVLNPKFEELIPKSWGIETAKDGEIATSRYYDPKSGSTIKIVSNSSDSSNLEGWDGHMLLFDEPPSQKVWEACYRGLTDHAGKQFFSMTLLKEPWIENDLINKVDEDGNLDTRVAVVHTTIWDNIGHGLTQKGVDNFMENLSEEQQKVRGQGVPAYKKGIVLDINRQKHVLNCTPVDIRPNWLIDIQIDYHPSKPQYILFYATCEANLHYVVHAIKHYGDGYKIADEIVKAIKTYTMRVNTVYADPLSKAGSKNQFMTEYDKIEAGLSKYGIPLYNAGKLKAAKEDGIMKINGLLKTINGLIGLYFFKSCGEAIKQCIGWMNDEDTGKPSKKDDDYPECLYRAALVDTEYYSPEDPDEEYHSNQSQQGRNKHTGY